MRNVFAKLFITTNFLILNYFLTQDNNFSAVENTISSVQFSDKKNGTYNNPILSAAYFNLDLIRFTHTNWDFPIESSIQKSLAFYSTRVTAELEIYTNYSRVYQKATISHKNENSIFSNFNFSYVEFMLLSKDVKCVGENVKSNFIKL